MKQLSYILLMLLCCAGAVDASYYPMVREGVKWVYGESWQYYDYDNLIFDSTLQRFYMVEFRGDTLIGDKIYKKAFRTSDVDFNEWAGYTAYTSTTIPIGFAREEIDNGKHQVFAIRNVNVPAMEISIESHTPWGQYDEGGHCRGESYLSGTECLLYHFYADENTEPAGEVFIGGQRCTVYTWMGLSECRIVEGIGYVDVPGDLMWPWLEGVMDEHLLGGGSAFHHLEDADGTILYKGPWFDGDLDPSDFDRSGTVDIDDLNQCINRVLMPESVDVRCDVTGDGRVDIDDVNAVINKLLKQQ